MSLGKVPAMNRRARAIPDPRTARHGRAWRLIAPLSALLLFAGCSLKSNVVATGTAPGNVTHLWVTVQEVWFATGADTPPESTAGWTKSVLATPISIDLAAISSATLPELASSVSLPAGTYRQVHFVLADSGDTLTTAAQSAGLATNASITLTDSTGTLTTAPLESPVPRAGITIPTDLVLAGSFNLGRSSSSTGTPGSGSGSGTGPTPSTSTLAMMLDGARDVLPYTYGTTTGYLLSPIASVADEKSSGGISGSIDVSALAAGYGAISVSAEIPNAANTHHVVVQRRVVGSGGAFTLYPLPAPSSGTTHYDLVIAGSGVDTVIIRNIPISAGNVATAVVAQSTPIVLTAATPIYANLTTQSTLLPGGARVAFYQTVPASGEIPYAIDSTAVDLVSRRLPGNAFALSNGPLIVGNYASGSAISASTLAAVEGAGGYVVGTEGLYRTDTLSTAPSVITGASPAPTPVVAPYPAIAAGGVAGTIALTLAARAGTYDSGFVVLSAGNRVVEAANVGTLLGTGGGTLNIGNVPGGSGLAATAGVPYRVAIRAWNSNSPTASFVRAISTGSTVLGNGGTAAVTLTLP